MDEIAISPNGRTAELDDANLRFIGEDLGWAGLWEFSGRKIELKIDGTNDGPYPRLIQLAETVLPIHDQVEKVSNSYLREFMGGGDNSFYRGSWKLRAMILRADSRPDRQIGNEFSVNLSVQDDDYGQWTVAFRVHGNLSTLGPYLFSRKQM